VLSGILARFGITHFQFTSTPENFIASISETSDAAAVYPAPWRRPRVTTTSTSSPTCRARRSPLAGGRSGQYAIRVKDAHGYRALRHEPDVDLRHCGHGKDVDAGVEV